MTALRVFSLKIVEVDTERNGAKHSAAFAQLSVATTGALFCSSSPLPPSPPAEKASACEDKTGQASAEDGPRHDQRGRVRCHDDRQVAFGNEGDQLGHDVRAGRQYLRQVQERSCRQRTLLWQRHVSPEAA